MRLHELLPVYLDGALEIIDLSHEEVDLRHHLRVPDSVRYDKYPLAEAEKLDLGPAALALSLLGPNPPAQTDPEALAPVLRRLQPGGRVIALIGWPIPELPYHRLLGPLVDGSCQVIETVPLERASIPSTHAALIVERVDKLAPLRAYLTDIPTEPIPDVGPISQTADELRTMLRVVNEYVLGDLVTRPLRRRLIELENAAAERDAAITRVAELNQLVAEREARLRQLERQLGAT
jgi:hypothetical protein